MPVIHLIIILALIGLALWAANAYIPMQPTVKRILNVVVIIAVVLWLLSVFGILGSITTIRTPRF